MEQSIHWIQNRLPQPVRYILAGGTGFAAGILFLTLFVEVLHIWYLTASLATFVIATFVSYWMQKNVTFQNRTEALLGRQMLYFYALAILNAGFNSLLLYTFVERFAIFYLFAQFYASATIALYSFFVYRYLFKQQPPRLSNDRRSRG
jgi:putative flippase GtrA